MEDNRKMKQMFKQIFEIMMVYVLILLLLASYLLVTNEVYKARYYAGDESYYLYK